MTLIYHDLLEQFENYFYNLPFQKHHNSLLHPIHYALKMKGKRVRPLCCLVTNNIFGELNEDGFATAAAIEMFHNFTLIHDDIIDNSALRRRQPTLFKKYGLNAGILSGDALLILAYQQIERVHTTYRHQLLSLFNTTAINVCLGQQLDIDFEQQNIVSLEHYIDMIRLKTAVLLACSFTMGGILAKQDSKTIDHLYHLGENLGIAFQIQDDLLDVYGHTKETGKTKGVDIINNKKTFLLTQALNIAQPHQQKQFAIIKNMHDENKKIEETIALFESLDIQAKTKAYLNQYYEKCHYYLTQLAREKAEQIEHIITWIMDRKS